MAFTRRRFVQGAGLTAANLAIAAAGLARPKTTKPCIDIYFSPLDQFYTRCAEQIAAEVQKFYAHYGIALDIHPLFFPAASPERQAKAALEFQRQFLETEYDHQTHFGVFCESEFEREHREREQGVTFGRQFCGFADTAKGRAYDWHRSYITLGPGGPDDYMGLRDLERMVHAWEDDMSVLGPTVMTIAHELGHLFSLWHTHYEAQFDEYWTMPDDPDHLEAWRQKRPMPWALRPKFMGAEDVVPEFVAESVPNLMSWKSPGMETQEHPWGFGLNGYQVDVVNDYLQGGITFHLMKKHGFRLSRYVNHEPLFYLRIIHGDLPSFHGRPSGS